MFGGVALSTNPRLARRAQSRNLPTNVVHNPSVSSSRPTCSYLVCATPRSGSTLLCEALKSTGVAGVPEEYFEALRPTGRPRRPQEYFQGVEDPSIAEHLGEY